MFTNFYSKILAAAPEVGVLDPRAGYVTSGADSVKGIIDMALRLIVILAVGIIMYGGQKYILAKGEQKALMEAQAIVINAVIGLIIAFTAYFIVYLALQAIFPGSTVTIPDATF